MHSLQCLHISPHFSNCNYFICRQPKCESVCEEPVCDWKCHRPDNCPKPKVRNCSQLVFVVLFMFTLPMLPCSVLLYARSRHTARSHRPLNVRACFKELHFSFLALSICFTDFFYNSLPCRSVLLISFPTACPVGVVIAGCVSVQPATATGVVRQVVAGNVLA